MIKLFTGTPRHKNILKFALIFLLCCPLLLINIRDDIDWGDDNAHYLLQAKYIVNDIPQSQTQYVYNINCQQLGPPAYPMGFPLLLSVVYYFEGMNFLSFSLYLTAFLIILALLMLWLYKDNHRFLTSVFLILIVVYNPWTLAFKSEIMSEIPFMVVLILTILIYKKSENIFSLIIVGLLTGYLISTRTIGAALPLAFLIDVTSNGIGSFRKKESTVRKIILKQFIKIVIIFFFSFGLYFLLNNLIFDIPDDSAKGYYRLFSFDGLGAIILQNLAVYTEVLKAFFSPQNGKWLFLPLITQSLVFTFILLGFFSKIIKKPDFTDFFVILYMLVLLVYPYTQSGFRFLFPILPFLLSYAVLGLKTIRIDIKIRTSVKIILLGLLLLIQYIYGFNELNKQQFISMEGPCNAESKEAFDFIIKQTPEDAVFAFNKPRALALFTDRKCISNNLVQPEKDDIKGAFFKAGVWYYLLYTRKKNEPDNPLLEEMVNKPLENYIENNRDMVSLIWANKRFKLYKRIKFR